MEPKDVVEACAMGILLAWQGFNTRMFFQLRDKMNEIRDSVLKHENTLYPNGNLAIEVQKHAQTLYGPGENRDSGLVSQVAYHSKLWHWLAGVLTLVGAKLDLTFREKPDR